MGMGCCTNDPKRQVQGASISLLVLALFTMSLGATNFCFQYNRHNFERSDDITSGTGYIGEGMWGSAAGIIAGTLGIVASCVSDATFITMHRIQTALATLSTMTTLGAFGFDVWLLIREDAYWLIAFYENIDIYADILLIWAAELVMQLMTCVVSAVCICRLGCCCCGCPDMTSDETKEARSNEVAPLNVPETTEAIKPTNTTDVLQQTVLRAPPNTPTPVKETKQLSPIQPVVVSTQRRESNVSDAIRVDQTLTFYVDNVELKTTGSTSALNSTLTPIAD